MALPESREYTGGPGAPIQSSAFNILQDCIIGRKFPTTSFYFPGNAFSRVSAGGAGFGAGGYFQGDAGVICRLPFEPGTEIVSISFAYDQGNNINPMNMGIERNAPLVPTFVQTVILSRTSVPAGHTVETSDATALGLLGIPTVIAAGFAYSLFASLGVAAHKLYGARVIARRG